MQSQTPHTPSVHPDNAIELAKNGSWQQIFQTATPSVLTGEEMWSTTDNRHIKEIGKDHNLLDQAVREALAQGAWHFLQQLFHEGFAKACPPALLLASPQFLAPITAVDRPVTDTELAKISLWRSILVANPWHTIELSAKDEGDWKQLSVSSLNALSKSSTPATLFSNPGHLIHVVDVVNIAVNALRHRTSGPLDHVRVGLREAVASMVECAGQTKASVKPSEGALRDLNFPIIIQERDVRVAFLGGIAAAKDRVAASSFLHNLASQDGPASQWLFRVTAATHLAETSAAPVASMFGVLAEAKDPSVRAFALKTASRKLEFPLSRDVRDEVTLLGPLGGQILSRLLVGADRSHRLSGWFDTLPLLIRQYTHAAAAAHVEHGVDTDLISSLSIQKGGPLSVNQVSDSLVALDHISLEGLATMIRRIIRA